ncbi:MAG: hypothetical protein ACD_80C00170G0002 [uncultured bacterium (gcode 4)]|uniref:HMA domain-containing protein n=1 Tax=uncultured bacterium (gcode 4) TaxID=1234023 RepID=K1XWB4_9BACT|nr:MAG: hypothetical protein ACD_80C00170G0002 [uncultured bacterium (gcode 4)]
MATTKVEINCDACVRLIKTLPGIKSVSVSGKTATVEFDEKKVSEQKIKQSIK